MINLKSFAKTKLPYVLLYVMLFCAVCFLLTRKVNYHWDELITYIYSNNFNFLPEEGREYIPAAEPFLTEFVSHGLDIGNVWERQALDTHPPLYYLLVHMICTLFEGTFSKYYAGAVNVIFILLTLYVYGKITENLVDNDTVRFVLMFAFILSAGILSAAIFLRMYVVAMFFVTAMTSVVVRNIEHFCVRDFVLIGVISVCGGLTHYYFILFAVFISIPVLIIMLMERRYREAGGYVIAGVLAGICVYLIFPSIISHLFLTGRGAESIENLAQKDFFMQLGTFFTLLDNSLFAGILRPFICLTILALLIRLFAKNDKAPQKNGLNIVIIYRYVCVLFPVIAFLIVVSKSAPYDIARYLYPVFAVAMAGVLSLVYVCIRSLFPGKGATAVFAAICLFMTGCGLYKCEWEGLYLSEAEAVEYAVQNGENVDAYLFCEHSWRILPHFVEARNCHSSTFYTTRSGEDFAALIGTDGFLQGHENIALFFEVTDPSVDEYIKLFGERCPEYELIRSDKEMGSYYFRAGL